MDNELAKEKTHWRKGLKIHAELTIFTAHLVDARSPPPYVTRLLSRIGRRARASPFQRRPPDREARGWGNAYISGRWLIAFRGTLRETSPNVHPAVLRHAGYVALSPTARTKIALKTRSHTW